MTESLCVRVFVCSCVVMQGQSCPDISLDESEKSLGESKAVSAQPKEQPNDNAQPVSATQPSKKEKPGKKEESSKKEKIQTPIPNTEIHDLLYDLIGVRDLSDIIIGYLLTPTYEHLLKLPVEVNAKRKDWTSWKNPQWLLIFDTLRMDPDYIRTILSNMPKLIQTNEHLNTAFAAECGRTGNTAAMDIFDSFEDKFCYQLEENGPFRKGTGRFYSGKSQMLEHFMLEFIESSHRGRPNRTYRKKGYFWNKRILPENIMYAIPEHDLSSTTKRDAVFAWFFENLNDHICKVIELILSLNCTWAMDWLIRSAQTHNTPVYNLVMRKYEEERKVHNLQHWLPPNLALEKSIKWLQEQFHGNALNVLIRNGTQLYRASGYDPNFDQSLFNTVMDFNGELIFREFMGSAEFHTVVSRKDSRLFIGMLRKWLAGWLTSHESKRPPSHAKVIKMYELGVSKGRLRYSYEYPNYALDPHYFYEQ